MYCMRWIYHLFFATITYYRVSNYLFAQQYFFTRQFVVLLCRIRDEQGKKLIAG